MKDILRDIVTKEMRVVERLVARANEHRSDEEYQIGRASGILFAVQQLFMEDTVNLQKIVASLESLQHAYTRSAEVTGSEYAEGLASGVAFVLWDMRKVSADNLTDMEYKS